MKEIINAKGVIKSYGNERCLNGAELTVYKGEFVSVMGESGSGKSTFMEILAGIRAMDGGEVTVCGKNIFALSESALARMRRTQIGVVYQSFRLISTLTAGDNISLPLVLEGVPGRECRRRVRETAAALGVEDVLDKYPDLLSGGQQQRVAIARAVIYQPEILFLDEPTGSLDSVNSERTLDFLAEMNRSRGTTVLQITHSGVAAAYGGRTVHISNGVITQ